MQAAAIQACPQILDNDLNLRVKDNVVAMLVLCSVSTDQRLVAKYVFFFLWYRLLFTGNSSDTTTLSLWQAFLNLFLNV